MDWIDLLQEITMKDVVDGLVLAAAVFCCMVLVVMLQ